MRSPAVFTFIFVFVVLRPLFALFGHEPTTRNIGMSAVMAGLALAFFWSRRRSRRFHSSRAGKEYDLTRLRGLHTENAYLTVLVIAGLGNAFLTMGGIGNDYVYDGASAYLIDLRFIRFPVDRVIPGSQPLDFFAAFDAAGAALVWFMAMVEERWHGRSARSPR